MRKGLVAAVAIAALAGGPAGAATQACSVTYCSHVLKVGKTPATWTTPQRFTATSANDAYIGTRALSYWRAPGSACTGYLSGYGVLIKVSGCGRGAQPLRFKALSLRSKPVAVRLVYG